MSRYHSYLNSTKAILSSYSGQEPFASFLKKYFSQHKQMGSNDRKLIGHLCYCYFRTGCAMISCPVEEKILASLFLCSVLPNDILAVLHPEWNEKTGKPVSEKLSLLPGEPSYKDIFPLHTELSKGIREEEFILSHLKQPHLFLRLRPGKEKRVVAKLEEAGISFEAMSPDCLALPNGSKIDGIIKLDEEAVVQDYSSQRVGELIELARRGPSDKVWDCCAGSGGKSILLYDLYPGMDLTVSDTRESILVNLKKRLAAAGIKKYRSFLAARQQAPTVDPDNHRDPAFNFILADIPCTGSGTWGRTPEQLIYFAKKEIDEYANLQRKILSAVLPTLKPGGYLLYITCSVFEKENGEMVEFIQKTQLSL